MTPAELRNANFNGLRDSLAERSRAVYRAFAAHGPGSTAQIAERSGISLLALRPRACDLAGLGLLSAAGERIENGKRATIYAVTDAATWRQWHAQNFAGDGQLQMGLHQGALTT